ncbi:HAD family hydrolase [Nanoarchaeota archaeon]
MHSDPLGGGKLRNKIISILSVDYPLSARRLFYRLKKDFGISVTYQAVHKALCKMCEEEILIFEDKLYRISLDWIDRLEIFTETVRKTHAKKSVSKQVKVISFDLEGSLFDSTFDELVWRTQIPRAYARQFNMSFEDAFDNVTGEYRRLRGKVLKWRDPKFWCKHFGLERGWRSVILPAKRMAKPYGDVVPVLKELKKDFSLVIVTHADRRFLDLKLKWNNLDKYFDRTFSVISDFKEFKKRRNIYLEVCKKLNVEPKEMIHVGDDMWDDYKIPMSVGVRSFLMDRSAKAKAADSVVDLIELRDKLRG